MGHQKPLVARSGKTGKRVDLGVAVAATSVGFGAAGGGVDAG